MEQLHIIRSKRKWGIFERNKNRSLKNFKHRDLAFHHAASIAQENHIKIIIHNTDGLVDFVFDKYYLTEQEKYI